MDEIEKMYENAGIEPVELDYPDNLDPIYPEFTAEKQLELIKWLIINRGFKPDYDEKEWGFCTYYIGGYYRDTFEEALANLLNELWQDLTDVEKKQIRDILKG